MIGYKTENNDEIIDILEDEITALIFAKELNKIAFYTKCNNLKKVELDIKINDEIEFLNLVLKQLYVLQKIESISSCSYSDYLSINEQITYIKTWIRGARPSSEDFIYLKSVLNSLQALKDTDLIDGKDCHIATMHGSEMGLFLQFKKQKEGFIDYLQSKNQ